MTRKELMKQLEMERQKARELSHSSNEERLQLRYLYASPLQFPQLDFENEVAGIEEAVDGVMDVDVQVASVESLSNALFEPDLYLHITAHTDNRTGSLLLEEDRVSLGTPKELGIARLEELLQLGGLARVAFLFLAACRSERLAQVFHCCGVRHVVFCPTAVRDSRARCFAKSLYGKLAASMPLAQAFAAAKCEAHICGDDAEYGLLSNDSLAIPARPRMMSLMPRLRQCFPRNALKRKVEDFVGRVDDIRLVLFYLVTCERRLVVLHSEKPFGCTATLTEIAHFAGAPGRRWGGQGRLAFFPDKAPGGLLIVDDADRLSEMERDEIRRHLSHDGSQVLAGSRGVSGLDALVGEEKPMFVELPALRPEDATKLFLKRCQRPLLANDLLNPKDLKAKERKPTEPVQFREAMQLLQAQMVAFGGLPGKIRRAVDMWAQRGSPTLNGNVAKLAHEATLPAVALGHTSRTRRPWKPPR